MLRGCIIRTSRGSLSPQISLSYQERSESLVVLSVLVGVMRGSPERLELPMLSVEGGTFAFSSLQH